MVLEGSVKVWWKSKTIWFNLIVAMLAALEATFHFLQPIFGGMLYGIGAVVIAVVNAALRIITTQPVTVTSNAAKRQE